jgi:hypothetical protein
VGESDFSMFWGDVFLSDKAMENVPAEWAPIFD